MALGMIRKADLAGSSRHIKHDTYETTRFLLEDDGIGVTVTDIVLAPGPKQTYGYDNLIEIGYCIEGRGTIEDLSNGA
ncbi:MAG: ectoine synthase [Pseudomonadota bacterium]